MHNNPASGHQGVKKTLSLLQQGFYWVGMRKDVPFMRRLLRQEGTKATHAKTTRRNHQLRQKPQERLAEVNHQVRGALEFSSGVMKCNYDVKASQVCYKDGDKDRLYNPLRKKDVIYRIRGGGKAQPKVDHANRLRQYHGLEQYTWEDSEEQLLTTDEDQTWGNPTIDQEEEHHSLLAKLGVTGEGG
ncbi:putative Integrase zinc binding domain-containing protein 2 [Homarus americanus]|uniref:Putative Integrase zinc binding domain-containing protein 2 n=1 Tax=Homarus americanus TaxID=6706 RepID=A0A8J5THY3_HOMAM|nr:putative Integrase zinc binding domain-containing protein 2 [Homarus americanus]